MLVGGISSLNSESGMREEVVLFLKTPKLESKGLSYRMLKAKKISDLFGYQSTIHQNNSMRLETQ
jgi:hypothetical protein